MLAVVMALLTSRRAAPPFIPPAGSHASNMLARAARQPTTIPCTSHHKFSLILCREIGKMDNMLSD